MAGAFSHSWTLNSPALLERMACTVSQFHAALSLLLLVNLPYKVTCQEYEVVRRANIFYGFKVVGIECWVGGDVFEQLGCVL